MLLVMQIVVVVFAAVMVFFPRKIWEIFYGNFSKNAQPREAMLIAYRMAGGIALAVWLLRGIWKF
ncbi:hypothetical protein [Anaerotignum sp.]|uniref:hypothetical protein n=1 Tax=Anaerotignum sp. TaxID=2039241 RepID=UPI002A915B10|nr:hypothetical protein [Anaerotignum sp.]MCI7657800.1 hypothetical protein [Clostridia bacterium]MDY5415734.1 hypothetical protein [Anaerotignum sp.]